MFLSECIGWTIIQVIHNAQLFERCIISCREFLKPNYHLDLEHSRKIRNLVVFSLYLLDVKIQVCVCVTLIFNDYEWAKWKKYKSRTHILNVLNSLSNQSIFRYNLEFYEERKWSNNIVNSFRVPPIWYQSIYNGKGFLFSLNLNRCLVVFRSWIRFENKLN